MIKYFGFIPKAPITEQWEVPSELEGKLSDSILHEIYKEGTIRFDSTIEDINLIKSRAYTLLTILISLLGIIISLYFSDNLSDFTTNLRALTFLYALNIGVVVYCIVQLVIIIFPNLVKLKGEEPKAMNYQALATMHEEEQKSTYLLNSLTAIQDKISFNDKLIQNKVEKLQSVITILTVIFVFRVLFYLFS